MKQSKRPRSILVSMLVNLGDVVMQTAQLDTLRQYVLPEGGRLGVLVRPEAAEIVMNNPLVDQVLVYPYRSGSLWAGLTAIKEKINKEGFDCYFSLDRRPRAAVAALLAGVKERIGPDRLFPNRPAKLWTHFLYNKTVSLSLEDCAGSYMAMFHKLTTRAFGLTAPLGRVTLPEPPRESRERAEGWLGPAGGRKILGLCLRTKEPSKTWPQENYRLLLHKLKNNDPFIYIIGGPDDRAYAEGLLAGAGLAGDGLIANLAGRTSLMDLAALAERTDLFIGPDNGAAHLMAHCGLKKMISIMMGTSPESVADSLSMTEFLVFRPGDPAEAAAELIYKFAEKSL